MLIGLAKYPMCTGTSSTLSLTMAISQQLLLFLIELPQGTRPLSTT